MIQKPNASVKLDHLLSIPHVSMFLYNWPDQVKTARNKKAPSWQIKDSGLKQHITLLSSAWGPKVLWDLNIILIASLCPVK